MIMAVVMPVGVCVGVPVAICVGMPVHGGLSYRK
jgi:hypothetical protein